MEICNRYDCTGCMACLNACPTNAISVSADKKGFYYPLIDNEKCINCNKCKNTCPANKGAIESDKKPQVFACWQKNTEIRRKGVYYGPLSFYVNAALQKEEIEKIDSWVSFVRESFTSDIVIKNRNQHLVIESSLQ